QAGEDAVGGPKMAPFAGGPRPPNREPAENPGAPAGRLIADRREVGNELEIPEQHADDEVGADGERIPDQRRAEVDPEPPLVRVRNQPVETARASAVKNR